VVSNHEDTVTTPHHRYPNPGFVGSSSGFAIFNEVQSMSETPIEENVHSPYDPPGDMPGDAPEDQSILPRATHVLDKLYHLDIEQLSALILVWIDTGANLALAESFVLGCVHDMLEYSRARRTAALEPGSIAQTRVDSQQARLLSRNTCRVISMTGNSTFDAYFSQMTGPNRRWETLGLFFVAAARAASEIEMFPALYSSSDDGKRLARSMTYLIDCCLELCLGFDCLNDLQLILQYEQFHTHSSIFGETSFRAWRIGGDLATSLVALGYHEKIDQQPSATPSFVIELRKAIFARIFWADKALSVFMGRPPRILLAFCNFQAPDFHLESTAPYAEMIDFVADTRCSAKFAVLKEQSLEVFRMRNSNDQIERANMIRYDLEQLWLELPAHFRLTTTLAASKGSPFTRDFLANQRLEYLHTHFLLGLTYLQKHPEPNETLLGVSGEMLSLIVEIVLLRNKLVNSGTGWLWKVLHAGLPAAGVISLALLRRSGTSTPTRIKSKMIQDLCVLVAELRSGAIVSPGDPSFELLTQATSTISSILDSSLTLASPPRAHMANVQGSAPFSDISNNWNPDLTFEPWEFEADFWQNLSTHPTIAGMND
jgi:hypothetical protein